MVVGLPYFGAAGLVDLEVACVDNDDDIFVLAGVSAAGDTGHAEIPAPDISTMSSTGYTVVEEKCHDVFLPRDRPETEIFSLHARRSPVPPNSFENFASITPSVGNKTLAPDILTVISGRQGQPIVPF